MERTKDRRRPIYCYPRHNELIVNCKIGVSLDASAPEMAEIGERRFQEKVRESGERSVCMYEKMRVVKEQEC